MGFGGEVHDRVDPVFMEQGFDRGAIADVALHKRVAGIGIGRGQTRAVAGVGQLVERHDPLDRHAEIGGSAA